MSSIKLKKILTFSSQDETCKAANLLDGSGKWIGTKDGDTKQFVIIQLNESTRIKEIDIENESSAFIEILVGNLNDSEDDYQVLLSAISFMSPNESKTSTNTQRMKIFTNETNLDKTLSEKKWEVVKIVCTQPFNTNLQFGISSIKFFDEIVNENSKDAAKINTGIFSIKKELSTSDSTKTDYEQKNDDKKTESIYEKWKREKDNKKSENDESPSGSKRKLPISDDEEKDKKPETKKPNHEQGNSPKKIPTEQILKGVIFALSGFQNPLRSEIRDAGLKLGAKYRPDWTDDCTHLITAFSNTPKVIQVRKTGGTIITKEWIFDCKKEKKLLDCDDYKLEEDSDDDDDSKPRKAARNAKKNLKKLNKKDEFDDSYDEEEAENSDDRDFIVGSSEEEEEEVESSSSSSSEEEESSFDSEDAEKKSKSKKKKKVKKSKKMPKEKIKKEKKKKSKASESESETDLEEYMKKKKKEILNEKKTKKNDKTKTNDNKKKAIKYEDSDEEKKPDKKNIKKENSCSSTKTDVNSDMENDENINWQLPNFFDDKKFFLHGDFEAKKRKQLSKIIYAYGGEVNDYMSNDVAYIISDKKWNKEFQEGLDENPNLKFIEPDWLEACHKKKKLIPFSVFEITND